MVGDGARRRRSRSSAPSRSPERQPSAAGRASARAARRSRCCPAGRPGRGAAGGRAARRRRPGAGPGAEKVEAASTAKTRPAPSASIRSQCSSACARASSTYQPHGIAITTSGLRPDSSPQPTSGGLQAGRPGDVLAARDRDHLGDPVAADVGRVEPLQRDHRGGARDGADVPAALQLPRARAPGRTGRLASRITSSSISPSVLGSCCRPAACSAGGRDLEHVLEGDAQTRRRLGDDQVGPARQLLVELVQRLPSRPRLHRRSISRAERRSTVRSVGSSAPRRVVALMGDRDDTVAEPEREEHLGRGGTRLAMRIAAISHLAVREREAILRTPNGRRRPPPKYRAT